MGNRKSLLHEQGMPKAQCGSFVGKLVNDYGDDIVIEAVRATCVKRPPMPRNTSRRAACTPPKISAEAARAHPPTPVLTRKLPRRSNRRWITHLNP